MSDHVTPPDGAARRTGRPRRAEVDLAILEATRAALVELGWGKLTIGDVAVRAKVAKTTVYRRWHSKNELVVDAVAALLGELELPDLGSLQADVEGVVLQFAALLDRPETKTALMAVVAESTRDPGLRSRIREAIVDPQKRLVVEGRRRAQERGELPPEIPPEITESAGGDGNAAVLGAESAAQVDLIFDVIAGAVVHRTLVSGEPVDKDWTRRFATVLLYGLSAAAP